MSKTVFRVRYGETDKMGVVYHTCYIDWFAIGRTEWLRDKGITYREAFEEAGLYLPVVTVTCRYRKSVTYDDEVTLDTVIEFFSKTRIRFHYNVHGPNGLSAEGTSEHAFLDAKTNRPVDLSRTRPDLWDALCRIAGE